jgi:GT2 family glycosyltransferase/glycosyltransferase involved in cell wall biosynthesis
MRRRFDATRSGVSRRAVQRLPRGPVAVHIPVPEGAPLVSVIVPVHDSWRWTNVCLRALAAAYDPAIPMEIIVVDDASTDRTAELLARCTGVRIVRSATNRGFVESANAGAAVAAGRYLHFLNNDACVSDGWLRPLVDAFDDASVGAAVSQLRFPDGRLAEAGGVIWCDGRGSNYGRGGRPRDWRYASRRDVDYGSGASLMVRADAFREAGGLSAEFAPAYYEDADLCFALRAAGHRVVYVPRSVVYHAEGASYGSNRRAAAIALQEAHRERFAHKWAEALQAHLPAEPALVDRAARRLCAERTMVIVDEHVPFTDRDAGSRRIFAVAQLFKQRGWQVIFGSLDRGDYPPYGQALRDAGIDVLTGVSTRTPALLQRLGMRVDAAWLCRPSAAPLTEVFRETFGATIVFDTVDVHYLRLQREQEVLGRRTGWETMRERELAIARAADAAVVTSPVESALLHEAGAANVWVLPVVEPVVASAVPWEARSGIVFLGNFAHAPNADAAQWLCTEVMPRIWQRLPALHVTLAGADPPPAVRRLGSAPGAVRKVGDGRVSVPGYVPDAAALLERARVFVAPLRFGAGVKGKIVYALAHGIPVVTTPIGAEGIFPTRNPDGAEAESVADGAGCESVAGDCGCESVTDGAEAFAECVVRLYEDREAWERVRAKGIAVAQSFTPEAVAAAANTLFQHLERPRQTSARPTP